jgi:hypothetical protein
MLLPFFLERGGQTDRVTFLIMLLGKQLHIARLFQPFFLEFHFCFNGIIVFLVELTTTRLPTNILAHSHASHISIAQTKLFHPCLLLLIHFHSFHSLIHHIHIQINKTNKALFLAIHFSRLPISLSLFSLNHRH